MNDKLERLEAVGARQLAQALIDLAASGGSAADMVERLSSTPESNFARYHSKLAEFRMAPRFYKWGEAMVYASKLQSLLADLMAAAPEPRVGLESVIAFFESDEAILNQCDDSMGRVGEVFQYEGRALFVDFAAKCTDKAWVRGQVQALCQKDPYGVRHSILENLGAFLPEAELRHFVDDLWDLANVQDRGPLPQATRLLHTVETIATQLRDPCLFEKARLKWRPDLSHETCRDIATVYLEAGKPQEALAWASKVPPGSSRIGWELDDMLLAIHSRLGNREEASKLAWKIFRRCRSIRALAKLQAAIGVQDPTAIIDVEVREIASDDGIDGMNLTFLVEVGRIEDAEHYLMSRSSRLDEGFYGDLQPVAEAMSKAERFLPTVLIYRALLDSILRRGKAKAYRYGARYLLDMDGWALKISDWKGHPTHDEYKQGLMDLHYRKKGFWSYYSNRQ